MTIRTEIRSAAIVGLGYIGEPLLRACHKSGLDTYGVDSDPLRLKQLTGLLGGASHKLHLGDKWDVVSEVDVIVICVPTPVDKNMKPDYSFVTSAMFEVERNLSSSKRQLVVLESTVAPGTTGGKVKAILESQSGLTAGLGFSLAFSPERIDPQNKNYFLENTPKVVGGLTDACSEFGARFYRMFVSDVIRSNGLVEAEASKILENTYRHINIALINEFSDICRELKIDAREVIRLAATKPFGFQKFLPSVGAGGHCIPVDPNYFLDLALSELGRPSLMIQLANEINEKRPEEVASQILEAVQSLKVDDSSSPRILMLGLSYKSNVGDFRESRQIELARALANRGLEPRVHDPFLKSPLEFGFWVETRRLQCEIDAAEIIVLAQGHSDYLEGALLANVRPKLFNATGETFQSAWAI